MINNNYIKTRITQTLYEKKNQKDKTQNKQTKKTDQ